MIIINMSISRTLKKKTYFRPSIALTVGVVEWSGTRRRLQMSRVRSLGSAFNVALNFPNHDPGRRQAGAGKAEGKASGGTAGQGDGEGG